MLRETGDRLARHSPHETMNCPNCRTPMEDGLIDKTCWFSRQPSPTVLRIYRALLSLTAFCACTGWWRIAARSATAWN